MLPLPELSAVRNSFSMSSQFYQHVWKGGCFGGSSTFTPGNHIIITRKILTDRFTGLLGGVASCSVPGDSAGVV